MVNQETFGGRLRRERERRQIALSSISANTKISASFFEALERDDLSRWPTGIFRRAFIRAYEAGIGLDPDTITKEFYERFPDSAELRPMTVGEALAATPPAPPGSSARSETVLRLTLADASAPFVRSGLLGDMRSRLTAVACDAAMMLAVPTVMYFAFGSFWIPLGVFALLYELGGILILGNTPGVSLCALTEKGLLHPDPLRHPRQPPAARLLADFRNRAVRAAGVDHREDVRSVRLQADQSRSG